MIMVLRVILSKGVGDALRQSLNRCSEKIAKERHKYITYIRFTERKLTERYGEGRERDQRGEG